MDIMLLLWILIASFVETLVALAGQVFVSIFSANIKKYIPYLMSFAVGTLLAVIFLDILPEAFEVSDSSTVFAYVLVGFLFFFILTRVLSWYHCHTSECAIHHGDNRSGIKILFGDAVHNFIDGIIITFAFMVDFRLGVITSLAVLIHELPMEMSDFFILMNAGYPKRKALFYNFLIALTTPLGALLTYFFIYLNISDIIGPALGIVAGNFLYIAASDIVPELHDHDNGRIRLSSILQFSFILVGILVIYASGFILVG